MRVRVMHDDSWGIESVRSAEDEKDGDKVYGQGMLYEDVDPKVVEDYDRARDAFLEAEEALRKALRYRVREP